MDLSERFEKNMGEHLKFENVKNKRSTRPDVHAFILLDELFPGDRDLVNAAEHDIYYINVGLSGLQSLTDAQICDLIRCGILFTSEYDCLYSFV